jgi:hypothetical protein
MVRWVLVSAVSSALCCGAAYYVPVVPVTGLKPWPTQDASTYGGETQPFNQNPGPQYYARPQPIAPVPVFGRPTPVAVVAIRRPVVMQAIKPVPVPMPRPRVVHRPKPADAPRSVTYERARPRKPDSPAR